MMPQEGCSARARRGASRHYLTKMLRFERRLELVLLRALGGLGTGCNRADCGAAPPAFVTSCIVIGQTSRDQVRALLGEPSHPRAGATRTSNVVHYVYAPRGPSALASLFIEYAADGTVRSLSAGVAENSFIADDESVGSQCQ